MSGPLDLASIVRASMWPERMLENIRAELLGFADYGDDPHVGPAATIEDERAVIGRVAELLSAYGLETQALSRRYLNPLTELEGYRCENRTRIAHATRGILITRFVPDARGYVFEAQTSGTPDRPVALYYASSVPIAPAQYDPKRVQLEWIGKDPSKDHSIGRMQDRTFKQEFRRIERAVTDATRG